MRRQRSMTRKACLWDIFWMIGKEYLKHGEVKIACEYLDQGRSKAEQRQIRDPKLYADLAVCHFEIAAVFVRLARNSA